MEKGESIWTESSYKYRPDGARTMLERAGFRLVEQWVDGEDGLRADAGRSLKVTYGRPALAGLNAAWRRRTLKT